MLIFHIFNRDAVVLVRVFGLQRGQRNAAAADQCISNAVDDIAADGTDIELAPHHVGGDILVFDMLTVHQFNDGDPQCLSQGLEQGDVRQTLGGFPFGYGLAADADFVCQLCLGQIPGFPQVFDGGSGDISVHAVTSFLGKAYHKKKKNAT